MAEIGETFEWPCPGCGHHVTVPILSVRTVRTDRPDGIWRSSCEITAEAAPIWEHLDETGCVLR